MDYSDFRRQAIRSADIYLKYLQKHNKGISEAKVSHIRKWSHKVYLTLTSSLSPAALDSIELQICADRYPVEKIHPVDYQAERMLLVLQPERNVYDIIPTDDCSHISIVSSLLFLVERVEKWYLSHPVSLALPTAAPAVSLPALPDMAGGEPSEEQYKVVCGVLSTPLSYVWGAPGTGKTRYVLSNCILAYLREDRRVLLVAPTNNALDQMLSGVLEVLDKSGISHACIRRLGIPSRTFLGKYPDVCEQQTLEGQRTHLSKRISNLRQQLEMIRRKRLFETFLPALLELQAAFQTAEGTCVASSVSEEMVRETQSEWEDTVQYSRTLDMEINALTLWCASFPGRLSRLFRPRVYSKRVATLEETRRMYREAQHDGEILRTRLAAYQVQNAAAEAAYHAEYQHLCNRFCSLIDSLDRAVIPSDAAYLYSEGASEDVPARLEDFLRYIRAQNALLPPAGPPEDEQQLITQLGAAEAELRHMEDESASRQEQIRVLAMTIDRCIASTLSAAMPDFVPEHVFMDEAAYCSLIKGYTLLGFNCPLTLLGDHAQLPPVCEMADTSFKETSQQPVFLWAQSAIYLESAVLRPFRALYAQYAGGVSPDFQDLQCFTLSVTYRFGPALARVLADFIYTADFRSAAKEETSIRYISAPAFPNGAPRTSASECAVITTLAERLTEDHTDFAILTPYKNQISMISRQPARIFPKERIMTVHASQGREFHTVLLSVVDTTKKYFVDSNIPVGRAVLNTAISRTKSELVLVLDAGYWTTQKNQLIGRLLQIATPYKKE